ncbi:MAG TPA: hypothetical protein VJ765_03100 [Chitinophagaceae bacterium]|nr:hypothetical protein [Chitinophagaceae bacterium]
MEVHHHAHTPRKKWTHYFWEFLMLFLAVFCGFLAEYQLEHTIEKERGKQFVIMITQDLVKDTAILESGLQTINQMILKLDSATELIRQKKYQDKKGIKALYDLYLIGLPTIGFTLTDRTTVQLKNAGGMRLISKRNISDAIVEYWSEIDLLNRTEFIFEEIRIKIKDHSYTIFDNRFYPMEANNAAEKNQAPVLLTYEERHLIEFANKISHLRRALKNVYIRLTNRTKSKAVDLLTLIQEEYNLK